MPITMSRTTAAKRHAHLKRLAWDAREKGRRVSWNFLRDHPQRTTYARPALPHEHPEDDDRDFSPTVVIAQRDAFYPGILIVQVGLRAPTSLAAFVRTDCGEELARVLRDLACGDLRFTVANFTVVDGRIVPISKKVA
jgi:hypothetical protein